MILNDLELLKMGFSLFLQFVAVGRFQE